MGLYIDERLLTLFCFNGLRFRGCDHHLFCRLPFHLASWGVLGRGSPSLLLGSGLLVVSSCFLHRPQVYSFRRRRVSRTPILSVHLSKPSGSIGTLNASVTAQSLSAPFPSTVDRYWSRHPGRRAAPTDRLASGPKAAPIGGARSCRVCLLNSKTSPEGALKTVNHF